MTLEHILLIDDEPDIREVTQIVLESVGGLRVTCASRGQEGLELAWRSQPDLILLDVMMPGMSGLEVIEQLRQDPRSAETPVVFMTAKVQQREIDSYLAAGAKGVIVKPFDPLQLVDEVRRLAGEEA